MCIFTNGIDVVFIVYWHITVCKDFYNCQIINIENESDISNIQSGKLCYKAAYHYKYLRDTRSYFFGSTHSKISAF